MSRSGVSSRPLATGEQPLLSAIGLRGRIAGAILVTAVVALVVAAVVLLGPLEQLLRNSELNTLKGQLTSGVPASIRGRDPTLAELYDYSPSSHAYGKYRPAHDQLLNALDKLGSGLGAKEVALLGYAWPSGYHAQWVVAWPPDAAPVRGRLDDAAKAFREAFRERATGRPHALQPVYSIASINDNEYAQAALPFVTNWSGRQAWVLLVRKSLVGVNSAVATIRTAFLVAAMVALALTLLLGIPLSARIVRRLRVLRHAAVRLATEGPSVEVPVDRARDEVGDLARTFAMMQHHLLQQEEARRAFVATASHELRTPLATLDGLLELLDEDLSSGHLDLSDAQELIERARAQSKRLGRLAADLLDLSRIDAEVDLRSEPVELGELSRAVMAEFELGTDERGIGTVLDDHAGPVWALADPGSVARIVRILLDNAVKISPSGACVTVELTGGERAALSVSDSGPGVEDDERELIFERFMRGRQTGGQGFGLGLAIGRELALRMGGELILEERPGPGARFTLRLPVAQAPDIEPVGVS